MKKFAAASAVTLCLLVPSLAHAKGGEVSIPIGWGVEFHELGSVSKDSLIGQAFPGDTLVVGFAYHQLWIGFPLWNSGGVYVVCQGFDPAVEAGELATLREQTALEVSQVSGIEVSRLGKPWFYYVPIGWPFLVVIGVIVRLVSGPKPGRRFRRLWNDEIYRQSVARFLEVTEQALEPVPNTSVAVSMPEDPALRTEEAVEWIYQHGTSRRTAQRNFEFLMTYLIQHNHLLVFVREPAETRNEPDQEIEPEAAAT